MQQWWYKSMQTGSPSFCIPATDYGKCQNFQKYGITAVNNLSNVTGHCLILWNNIHISVLSYSKAQSAGGIEFKGLLICKVWMCLRIWSLNLIIVRDHNGARHWTSPLWGLVYLTQTILQINSVWTQQLHLWKRVSWILL